MPELDTNVKLRLIATGLGHTPTSYVLNNLIKAATLWLKNIIVSSDFACYPEKL